MRTVGQKGLVNPFQKGQVLLIVISVILVGLVESREKVRILFFKGIFSSVKIGGHTLSGGSSSIRNMGYTITWIKVVKLTRKMPKFYVRSVFDI